MADRRYSETEVAEIFRRATEAQQGAVTGGALTPQASSRGMTLESIQEIGREVGIPADLLAHVAQSLDRSGQPGTRRFLGVPIGVSRTVELPRHLSEAEWNALVIHLRDTFDARGNLRQDGGFRQWTNGNLNILLEPGPTGSRLRMRTRNAAAQGLLMGGGIFVFMAGVSLIGSAMAHGLLNVEHFADAGTFGLIGGGLFTAALVRVRGWLGTRRQQFAEIAARVAETVRRPADR